MQELFSYSLMASALGILIVFLILVVLSVLMVLIKRIFDTESVEKKPAAAGLSAGTASAPGQQLPLPVIVSAAIAAVDSVAFDSEWIAAATAAYLASEEDDELRPRASSWSSAGADKYDPWVANNKLTKLTI